MVEVVEEEADNAFAIVCVLPLVIVVLVTAPHLLALLLAPL
tara:strand:+ start:721 stop:843 length:123 start_codon:yes stop_codon:yes gene_type:complete